MAWSCVCGNTSEPNPEGVLGFSVLSQCPKCFKMPEIIPKIEDDDNTLRRKELIKDIRIWYKNKYKNEKRIAFTVSIFDLIADFIIDKNYKKGN